MEQKPHKKEELILANNVLKLAEALLKVNFLHIYLCVSIVFIAKQVSSGKNVVAQI